MRFALVVLLAIAAEGAMAVPLKCPDGPTQMLIESGNYVPRPGVVVVLQQFSATMVPMGRSLPSCLQKETDIHKGHVFISSAGLSKLFDQKMKGKQSISDVEIKTRDGQIVIAGKIHKIVAIPFELQGPVEPAPGGVLRLHADKIKAAGLPMKGLLKMLGDNLGSLMKSDQANGITVEQNTILFNPQKIVHVRGNLSSAKALPDGLAADYEPPAAPARSQQAQRSSHKPVEVKAKKR
jgi:hypothetical protein